MATVYVVIRVDVSDSRPDIHGVYESKQTAKRVYERLCDDTFEVIRMQRARIIRKKPR